MNLPIGINAKTTDIKIILVGVQNIPTGINLTPMGIAISH